MKNELLELTLPVSGMTCASCAARIEHALMALPGVAQAVVNITTKRAAVKFSTSDMEAAELVEAIREAGYDVPTETLRLPIGGMTCASCVAHVEGALNDVVGVLGASVNLATEQAKVIYIPQVTNREKFERAVSAAGYWVLDTDVPEFDPVPVGQFRSSPETIPDKETPLGRRRNPRKIGNYWALFTLLAFLLGSAGGYFVGRRTQPAHFESAEADHQSEIATLVRQINPAEGYTLPAKFGDVGPQLLAVGAIDHQAFAAVYQQAGNPLTAEQESILTQGSESPVVFTRENAHFLLNFFWALGLANQNPILTEGAMVQYSDGQVERFASTGGWTLAARPINEVFAGTTILPLNEKQQALVDEVAANVYRPCCNNPTHFPDCNHGMAMLGMLELLASQDASKDELFEAAKYANAYWYPNQTLELATFFQVTQKVEFDEVDARQLVSGNHSSAAGFQQVHQWLVGNGMLQQAPGGGSSCGV